MLYQVLIFSFLFSFRLYSESFSMNKIFHENNFQKAQKKVIKLGDLFAVWLKLDDSQKNCYQSSFVQSICSLSLDNYFFTRLSIKTEKTKKEDLIYLLKLQNQISNHINNLPTYDECLISSRHLFNQAISLIYNKIS